MLVLFAPLALLLSMQPIVQDPAYHDFADRRALLGVANFFDVVSSVPYLLIGVAGMMACRRAQREISWAAWVVFFAGVALVGPGSAWYHWNPSDATLVWDRLPMTLGFTALFVAILADYVNPRLAAPLLVPAVLVGLASVIYGYWYDDLRLYAWVQALPVLAILAAVLLYPPRYTHRGYMLLAFACYALAKAAELYDHQVFMLAGGLLSGHTAKHLLAAVAVWVVLAMFRRRTPVAGAPAPR